MCRKPHNMSETSNVARLAARVGFQRQLIRETDKLFRSFGRISKSLEKRGTKLWFGVEDVGRALLILKLSKDQELVFWAKQILNNIERKMLKN
jgi:hypothetical protein